MCSGITHAALDHRATWFGAHGSLLESLTGDVLLADQWEYSHFFHQGDAQNKQFQIPSNVNAPVSPLSPKLTEVKLIDYDFARYGHAAERKRLLERWDRDVASQAK